MTVTELVTGEIAGLGRYARRDALPAFGAAVTALLAKREIEGVALKVAEPDADDARDYLAKFRRASFLADLRARGYDISAEVAEVIATATVFESVPEMLDAGRADVLTSVVPEFAKREVAEAALRAGRHVLLGKPIARSGQEGERMIAVARECGRSLEIGYQMRDGVQLAADWLRGLIASGEFGPVSGLDLVSLRRDGIPDDPRYWANPRTGGVMRNLGRHICSTIDALTGSRPVAVERARSSNDRGVAMHGRRFACEDTISGVVLLESSIPVHLRLSWKTDLPPDEWIAVVIHGERGQEAEIRPIPMTSDDHPPNPDAYLAVVRREGSVEPFMKGPAPFRYSDCRIAAAERLILAPRQKSPSIDVGALAVEHMVTGMLESARRGGGRVRLPG